MRSDDIPEILPDGRRMEDALLAILALPRKKRSPTEELRHRLEGEIDTFVSAYYEGTWALPYKARIRRALSCLGGSREALATYCKVDRSTVDLWVDIGLKRQPRDACPKGCIPSPDHEEPMNELIVVRQLLRESLPSGGYALGHPDAAELLNVSAAGVPALEVMLTKLADAPETWTEDTTRGLGEVVLLLRGRRPIYPREIRWFDALEGGT